MKTILLSLFCGFAFLSSPLAHGRGCSKDVKESLKKKLDIEESKLARFQIELEKEETDAVNKLEPYEKKAKDTGEGSCDCQSIVQGFCKGTVSLGNSLTGESLLESSCLSIYEAREQKTIEGAKGPAEKISCYDAVPQKLKADVNGCWMVKNYETFTKIRAQVQFQRERWARQREIVRVTHASLEICENGRDPYATPIPDEKKGKRVE